MALAAGVVASGPTLARSAQPQNQGVTEHYHITTNRHCSERCECSLLFEEVLEELCQRDTVGARGSTVRLYVSLSEPSASYRASEPIGSHAGRTIGSCLKAVCNSGESDDL